MSLKSQGESQNEEGNGFSLWLCYFLVALSLALSVLAPALAVSQRVSARGTGQAYFRTNGLGVYRDSACTMSVSSVDWGLVEAGSSVSRLVYVRNQGRSAAA